MESEQIEQMRQMLFQAMARISATESISRMAFAMMCSFDGSPEMRDKLTGALFPLLLKQAKERDWPTPQPELKEWLRTQEAQILEAEFQAILQQIDAVRTISKRTVN